MMSKVEGRKKIGEDSGNAKLLSEIESISKALYLDKNPSRSSISAPSHRSKPPGKSQLLDSKSSAKYRNEDSSQKDKKSIWNWKPLKALSNVRNRKFNCCFSLQVHSIEGFPSSFENLSVCVHWKRRDGELVTRPVKVLEGISEFEEELTHTCLVYGSRSGPHHSAKYEAKHFLLYASVIGVKELDLGKHRVDLTRLLPLTLEELEEEKSSGKWTTNFKLSGEAKGATMNVSFGYTVVRDSPVPLGNNQNVPELFNLKQTSVKAAKPIPKIGQGDGRSALRRSGSLPGALNQQQRVPSRPVEDVKDLHEVLPTSKSELVIQVDMLYQKFDEDNLDSSHASKTEVDVFTERLDPIKSDFCPESNSSKGKVGNKAEFASFSAIEQGVEEELEKTMELGVEEEQEKQMEPGVQEELEKPMELGVIEEQEKPMELGVVEAQEKPMESGVKEELEKPMELGVEEEQEKPMELGLEEEQEKPMEPGEDEEQEKPIEHTVKDNDVSVAEDEIDDNIQIGSEEDSKVNLHDVRMHDHEVVGHGCTFKEDEMCSKESVMKELEAALSNVTNLESEMLAFPNEQENYLEVKTDNRTSRIETSVNLDDVTDSVANEFLDLLGIEHSPFGLSSESEPESPRECLLRQFEKDALAGGYSLFDFGVDSEDQIGPDYSTLTVPEWGNLPDNFELSSVIQDAEEEHQMETQADIGKTRAKMLEDLETEALMREWGLNDKAFQSSPKNSGCFGSPIDLPPEEPFELPPLGEGLGPFLQTKNGGFLRSMNPALFSNAKNGGNLIMQVSSPVVVPAEMGSGVTDILQHLASVGIEKLSMQANKLMPLEDITGKTVQQVAWESAASLEGPERQMSMEHVLEFGEDISGGLKNVKERSSAPRSNKSKSGTSGNYMGSEYVSLEDLAPLAMDKIEALSFEGLRIQSGMSNDDTTSSTTTPSTGETSVFQGKGINVSGSLGLEGAAGLQLLDIKDSGDDVDGLMGLSLTLDEWMRLDSGDIGDEAEISERTSKILAAHHASSLDMIRGGSKGERRRGKGSGKKCGLLGNNFTVALMVQLRDPLRDYEPVGTPMLALIQVERVFVPPKPRIYCKVSELRNDNEDNEELELVKEKVKEEKIEEKTSEEEGIAQFSVTEVRVAGLKVEPEPGKKKLWGTAAQQQSGSRWLLANGMGKSQKQPFIKSKTISDKPATSLTTKAQRGDKLWSILSRAK